MIPSAARTALFDLRCHLLRFRRSARNAFTEERAHRYLFVLCPPYAGSSLMHELLCTSPNVSSTNLYGVREGLGLPEVRRLIDFRRRWETSYDYPWDSIQKIWLSYWDLSKPILMDKSPPNLVRSIAIEEHFPDSSFIVMTRDPTAHCECLIRRNGMTPKDAALFCVRLLREQRKNLERCQRVLRIRYEDLVGQPGDTVRKLLNFVPTLTHLDHDRLFSAHNSTGGPLPITNLNPEKIQNLSARELRAINEVLENEHDVVSFFGYAQLELEQARG